MDVSIILVSYNTKDLTRSCLKSIYEYTHGLEFEVFAVDNNSADGSAEMIEKEFPQVKLIKNKENKGFGAANNIAVRMSSAKYVFCLNTDTLLLDNAVKKFFDYMENHPETGAAGGQLIDKDGQNTYSIGIFPGMKRLLFSLSGLRFLFPDFYKTHFALCSTAGYVKETAVNSIIGADLFLRKSIIDKTGAFDEQFFMYFEETDLCYRINKTGFNVMFLPFIKIIHLEGKSFNPNKSKYHKESILRYYKKNTCFAAYYILKLLLLFRR